MKNSRIGKSYGDNCQLKDHLGCKNSAKENKMKEKGSFNILDFQKAILIFHRFQKLTQVRHFVPDEPFTLKLKRSSLNFPNLR